MNVCHPSIPSWCSHGILMVFSSSHHRSHHLLVETSFLSISFSIAFSWSHNFHLLFPSLRFRLWNSLTVFPFVSMDLSPTVSVLKEYAVSEYLKNFRFEKSERHSCVLYPFPETVVLSLHFRRGFVRHSDFDVLFSLFYLFPLCVSSEYLFQCLLFLSVFTTAILFLTTWEPYQLVLKITPPHLVFHEWKVVVVSIHCVSLPRRSTQNKELLLGIPL